MRKKGIGAVLLLLLRASHQLHTLHRRREMSWRMPRVEVDKDTLLPIIHINDHCVLVLLFVFCGIGHIQPNAHLLDHLHDPVAP
jgi:hypothetical protein